MVNRLARSFGLIVLVALVVGVGGVASADPITWNFGGSGGNLGSSETFTSNSLTITADAYNYDWGSHDYNSEDLYQRNDSPDDIGLGVCGKDDGPTSQCARSSEDSEIDNDNGNNDDDQDVIRLNLTSLPSAYSLSEALLTSVEGTDLFRVYGSNSALPNLSLATLLASGGSGCTGTPNCQVTLTGDYDYLFFTTNFSTNGSSDFLLRSLTVQSPSTVPEPASLTLLGSGLLALARRRSRLQQ
jgi:hypothetical protein